MIISIQDESITGSCLRELKLEFENREVTIEEIITQRVGQEVDNYNQRLPEYYHGLVEPTEAEKTLNGFKLRLRKPIDREKQIYVALDAFQKNGFFVLINDMQADQLDHKVTLTEETKISFIKLTPLVGG